MVPVRFCLLAAILFSPVATALAESRQPLAEYVAKADDSYKWTVRRTGKLGSAEYGELILTSQTWRGIPWKHQLFVIKPSKIEPTNRHALLFITGGSWKDELEQAPMDDELPRDARMFATLADQLKTPVAVLLHVPQQPIFDGKHEDEIIAYTFEKYMRTGDAEWPLLLPMVKSAVRGMDAVTEYADKTWSAKTDSFTLTGASKRGWTTWLTGAVDERATAIAPMVIDVLNMNNQMKHQKKAWGEVSYQISDYSERGLIEQLDSEAGRSLNRIVDPYNYRDVLLQPKLIIVGTNDHYWPLDALNLYWDDLVGSNYILYVPNNRHGLKDLVRVTGSLNALHQHAANGFKLPKMKWSFERRPDKLLLRVESDKQPQKVDAWMARSETRDFRQSRWTARPARRDGDSYVCELPIPDEGHAAMFGEAVFDGMTLPYFLSTNVRIVGSEAVAE